MLVVVRRSNLNKGRIGKNRNTRTSPKSRPIPQLHARDEYTTKNNQQFKKKSYPLYPDRNCHTLKISTYTV